MTEYPHLLLRPPFPSFSPQSRSPSRLLVPSRRPAPLRISRTLRATNSNISSRPSRLRTSPTVKDRWANRIPVSPETPKEVGVAKGGGWPEAVLPRRRFPGGRVEVTYGRKAWLRGKSSIAGWTSGIGTEAVSSSVTAALCWGEATGLRFVYSSLCQNVFPVHLKSSSYFFKVSV